MCFCDLMAPSVFGRWLDGDVICTVLYCSSSRPPNLSLFVFTKPFNGILVRVIPYHSTGRLSGWRDGVPRGQRRGCALPRFRLARGRLRLVHRHLGERCAEPGSQGYQGLLRKVSLHVGGRFALWRPRPALAIITVCDIFFISLYSRPSLGSLYFRPGLPSTFDIVPHTHLLFLKRLAIICSHVIRAYLWWAPPPGWPPSFHPSIVYYGSRATHTIFECFRSINSKREPQRRCLYIAIEYVFCHTYVRLCVSTCVSTCVDRPVLVAKNRTM